MRRLPPGLLVLIGMVVAVVVLVPGSRFTMAEAIHDHEPVAHLALDVRTGATTALVTPALVPGDRVARCVVIDYADPAGAHIEVSADADGALADHLDLAVETVEVDDADDAAACAGAPVTATVLDGVTLASFADDTAPGSGVDARWAPSGPEHRTYRVTVTLPSGERAHGTSGAAEFRWEAHEHPRG